IAGSGFFITVLNSCGLYPWNLNRLVCQAGDLGSSSSRISSTVDSSASNDDVSTSVLHLLDGSSLDTASYGNLDTRTQTGNQSQILEWGVASSLLVQTGVYADDVS